MINKAEQDDANFFKDSIQAEQQDQSVLTINPRKKRG